MLLSIKKYIDNPVDQTKNGSHETLEDILKKEKDIFSISPPIHLSSEWKKKRNWLLAVTNYESEKFVLNRIDENKNFLFSVLDQWKEGGKNYFDRLK